MTGRDWAIAGAIVGGIALAVYIGTHTSPNAGTVAVQTQNTSNIDMANATTQSVLQELTTQQQIMNQLGLSSNISTPLSSTPTSQLSNSNG